jgi:hypothetical protein
MHSLKKRFIRERSKHTATHISRQINDALHAVGVTNPQSEARQRFNLVGSIRGLKVPTRLSRRKREAALKNHFGFVAKRAQSPSPRR